MIASFWQTRELREKLLIMIAAALTVFCAAYFCVVSPITKAKADAELSLARALEDKVLIDRALSRLNMEASIGASPAQDFDAFRSGVTSLAQEKGLEIMRLQARPDGSLQLVFDRVRPENVFIWLEEISDRPGGEVVRASLTAKGDAIEAVIDLRGAKS